MDGFEFPVEIIRSDRKRSASIRLDGLGIKVRVPKALSQRRIRDLIENKSSWITKKLNAARLAPPTKPKEYVSGETFAYLGKNYRLKVSSGDTASVKLKGGYFDVTVNRSVTGREDEIRALLIQWYKQHALERLAAKTKRYAEIIGVQPRSINVKSYKARWGSCSAKGEISYNWCIILMPHRIVDYVVVHELCHLLEHNHSPKYWNCVGRYVPDYKAQRQWLRQHSTSFDV
jgi:predicted metal-dependent hydrolase